MMYFKVTGQVITVESPCIVADSVNYLTADFEFSKDWDGLIKTASFRQGNNVLKIVLSDDDKITSEKGLNLTSGIWEVSVVGLKSGCTITSNVVNINVANSGVNGGRPFNITVDEANAIVAGVTDRINAVKQNLGALIDYSIVTDAVDDWMDEHYTSADWRLTDEEKEDITEAVTTALESNIAASEQNVTALQTNVTSLSNSITSMNTTVSGKQDKLIAGDGIAIDADGKTVRTAKRIVTAFKSGITATKSAHTDVTWEYGCAFSSVPYIFVTPSATPQNSTSRCIYNGEISVSVYAVTTTSCKLSIYNNSTTQNRSIGLVLMAVR